MFTLKDEQIEKKSNKVNALRMCEAGYFDFALNDIFFLVSNDFFFGFNRYIRLLCIV